MEGTITQLGLKNYLTDPKKPRVSFFSHAYENFSNYAKDTRKIQFLSSLDFGKKVSFRFDQDGRYGDLITNLVLQVELPLLPTTSGGTNVVYTNGIGNALIKNLTLRIGGNVIEMHGAEWMDVWTTLSIPQSKRDIYNYMIKKSANSFTNGGFKGGFVYIPIMLWFCQNVGSNTHDNIALNLPLIAMRNCEIELSFELRLLSELIVYERVPGGDTSVLSPTTLAGLKITSHELLVDYIILEPEERIKYLEAKRQMYLITQTQHVEDQILPNSTSINMSLRNLRYPITELIWVIRSKTNRDNNDYFNYTNKSSTSDPTRSGYIKSVRLTFDGRDRIPELNGDYFTSVEPFKIHDSIPANTQINCWSFALNPEDFSQPSGSCNFSDLHDPRLIIELKAPIPVAAEIHVFAVNYNVMQMDDKGNVWLLHNLSKSSPGELPDLRRARYIDECSLTASESSHMRDLISKINELNLFTDPRLVETGLANLVTSSGALEDTKGIMPLLDAIIAEVSIISKHIYKLKQSGAEFKNKEKRQANIGGLLINLDDFEGFLNHLVELALTRIKKGA